MSELYEKSIHKLELDVVLQQLADCAVSDLGKKACLQIRPSSDIEELRKMGANSRVIETTAIITGVDHLTGARVNATDLRAGASLVIAALMAEGVTEISGVEYIMRGYERFGDKLRSLGAHIEHLRDGELVSEPAFLPNI